VPHVEYLTGDAIYKRVMAELIPSAKDSLLIATATLKATRVKKRDGSAESIVRVLNGMARRGVEVRVLHSGVPSGPFLEDLKSVEPGVFQMRRCPRTHFKAAIVDGQLRDGSRQRRPGPGGHRGGPLRGRLVRSHVQEVRPPGVLPGAAGIALGHRIIAD
jgi:hypothetical protein